MEILIIFSVGLSVLLAWLLWYRHETVKLIHQHQAEWNRIKENTPEELRFDAWIDYTDALYRMRDPIVGACLPRY